MTKSEVHHETDKPMQLKILQGAPYPLGATWDRKGSQFRDLLRACHESGVMPV